MKKVNSILCGLLFIVSMIGFSWSAYAQGDPIREPKTCNAEFNGEFCDVSKLGNCAVLCYPN
jgi:hypothetical protein